MKREEWQTTMAGLRLVQKLCQDKDWKWRDAYTRVRGIALLEERRPALARRFGNNFEVAKKQIAKGGGMGLVDRCLAELGFELKRR